MDVKAIFLNDYDGELSGAVWLIDSERNRVRFESATDLDHNSALFFVAQNASLSSRLLEIFWSIQDHYPEATTISVMGLDESIAEHIEDECETELTEEGFICRPSNARRPVKKNDK